MRTTIFLGAATALIAGCSGGDGGGGGVSGTVTTGMLAPMPLARVMVVGEAPTQTNLKGRFTSDAPDPYDLVVEDPGTGHILYFVGVTDRSPEVILGDNFSGLVEGGVSGTLTGGAGFPSETPLGHSLNFVPNEDIGLGASGSFAADDSGSFEAGLVWGSLPSATGRLSVLQYQTGSAPPVEWTGYGAVDDVTVTALETAAVGSIALADVPEGSVSGIATLPEGFQVTRHRLQVFEVIDDDLEFIAQFNSGLTTSTSFDLTTPAGDGFWVSTTVLARDPVEASSTSRALVYSAPTAAGLTLDVPAPLVATSPAEDATTHSLASGFAWEATAFDGVYTVMLHGTNFGLAGDTVPLVQIFTDAASVTLPDLAPLGIGYGTGSRILQINANDQRATVDEFLAFEPLVPSTEVRHFAGGVFRSIEVTP